MRCLWPVVASIIILVGLASGVFAIYTLGSFVGGILELIVLAILGLPYDSPSNNETEMGWFASGVWAVITKLLRAISFVIGVLLVVTYLRAISGHFDGMKPIFRGSRVRTADDIFPDLDGNQGSVNGKHSPFRGSVTNDADSLFATPKQPVWKRLWQSIKNLYTRNFAGDDLP